MKTIMVVDDESKVQEQIKKYLDTDDYKIISVNDSREAFKKMNEKTEDYNLLLIDSPIPGFEGKYGLISMKPDTKIGSYKSNNEDFLEKPFTKEELLDFLKNKV